MAEKHTKSSHQQIKQQGSRNNWQIPSAICQSNEFHQKNWNLFLHSRGNNTKCSSGKKNLLFSTILRKACKRSGNFRNSEGIQNSLAKYTSPEKRATDYTLKVGLSPSRKICFICFNESFLKMMKNTFYFISKALFVLKDLSFYLEFLVIQKKLLDQKDKVNFEIYNVTTWLTNNYNTHIALYLTKLR